MTKELVEAITALLRSIAQDENKGGGLLSRDTHRLAGDVRQELSRALQKLSDTAQGHAH